MKLLMIAVAVLMSPLIGYSQISMHQLPENTSAFGLGLYFHEDVTIISGVLEYGIDSFTKSYFYGAIGLIDDDDIVGDVPPRPKVGWVWYIWRR